MTIVSWRHSSARAGGRCGRQLVRTATSRMGRVQPTTLLVDALASMRLVIGQHFPVGISGCCGLRLNVSSWLVVSRAATTVLTSVAVGTCGTALARHCVFRLSRVGPTFLDLAIVGRGLNDLRWVCSEMSWPGLALNSMCCVSTCNRPCPKPRHLVMVLCL